MKEEGVLAFARYCGAEAKANGRRNMSAEDRCDIATKADMNWSNIPQGMKEKILDAWNSGWRDE